MLYAKELTLHVCKNALQVAFKNSPPPHAQHRGGSCLHTFTKWKWDGHSDLKCAPKMGEYKWVRQLKTLKRIFGQSEKINFRVLRIKCIKHWTHDRLAQQPERRVPHREYWPAQIASSDRGQVASSLPAEESKSYTSETPARHLRVISRAWFQCATYEALLLLICRYNIPIGECSTECADSHE